MTLWDNTTSASASTFDITTDIDEGMRNRREKNFEILLFKIRKYIYIYMFYRYSIVYILLIVYIVWIFWLWKFFLNVT